MTKRLAIVAALVAGALGLAGPALADRGQDHDWACVFVTSIDDGACLQSPIPDYPPEEEDVVYTVEEAGVTVPTLPPVPSAPTGPSAPTAPSL